MRIISGYLKGKKISFLKNKNTRPLRDMVKENVFNVLEHSNNINLKIKDSNILDLYSGVGSFGIECISRDAKKVTFIEKDKNAQLILTENFEKLEIENKAQLYKKSASDYFKIWKKEKFDIIFMDPPYKDNGFFEELKIMSKIRIYNTNHVVIIHRENEINEDLSKIFNILVVKKYGRSKIYFGKLTN